VILAGDVGGTKTLLALYEGTAAPVREASFRSADFASLGEIVAQFLTGKPRAPLRAACFAVAGPVVDGRSKTTNLPWQLDERPLSRALGAPVRLLNDLEGAGYGLDALVPGEVEVLQRGAARQANLALIAAGTGLGEAIIVRAHGRRYVVASEGGHADFAPRTDLEAGLLNYLRKELDHVSYERVVSGPGLHNIYRFLRDSGYAEEPEWLTERLADGDPSAAISEIALEGGHPLCVKALELFVSAYGAEAGNLALKALALGGVFVAGGIAPKILPALRGGAFVEAFSAKGRYADLLRSIRVSVVLNPRLTLLGAAAVAREMEEAGPRIESGKRQRR
jgi:glucokinase